MSATEDHIAGVRHTNMSSTTPLLEPPAGPSRQTRTVYELTELYGTSSQSTFLAHSVDAIMEFVHMYAYFPYIAF